MHTFIFILFIKKNSVMFALLLIESHDCVHQIRGSYICTSFPVNIITPCS